MLILSLAFGVYTLVVYRHCDTGTEACPPAARRGWQVWQEKNCQGCHQLYGLGGYLGPDLTNTASQKGEDYMRTFIRYGTGRMPNLHLRDHEVEDVIAFLAWVDQSGHARVPDSAVSWWGSYKDLEK
jgi:nitric oxide reductase subunit C